MDGLPRPGIDGSQSKLTPTLALHAQTTGRFGQRSGLRKRIDGYRGSAAQGYAGTGHGAYIGARVPSRGTGQRRHEIEEAQ
jgi:hypothetical protein